MSFQLQREWKTRVFLMQLDRLKKKAVHFANTGWLNQGRRVTRVKPRVFSLHQLQQE